MFDSPADAAQALRDYFDPPRIEIVVESLVPAIVLHPAAGKGAPGGSRLGGTPDAPAGFVWPRPPAPADPEEIARRGNEDAAAAMRAHMALGLPYAFIAQIDLSEASALGSVASSLPSEGRLLFFYDHAIGPWETGTRPVRVIWERSPVAELVSHAMPEDLAAAAERERAEIARINAEFPLDDDEGDGADREEGTIYGAPARAVSLRATYRLPHTAALEVSTLPELEAIARAKGGTADAEELHDAYEEALQEHHDSYPEESWRRQQLLGSPMPEQDDPRYDAVVVSEFGKKHLTHEEWNEHRAGILEKARDWVLLLQLDVGDWMQARFGVGTVYFVIRRSDLEQCHFENAVAVYQQT